jgi:hypothetical protein
MIQDAFLHVSAVSSPAAAVFREGGGQKERTGNEAAVASRTIIAYSGRSPVGSRFVPADRVSDVQAETHGIFSRFENDSMKCATA